MQLAEKTWTYQYEIMQQENICTTSIHSNLKYLATKSLTTFLSNILFSLPVEYCQTSAINTGILLQTYKSTSKHSEYQYKQHVPEKPAM